MNKMEFCERINIDNAKYLCSLKEEELKDLFCSNYEEEENEENWFKSTDYYIRQLKQWLHRSVIHMQTNGFIKAKYKYSSNLQNAGRIYVKNFGVQKLERNLRGFLIDGIVNDFDMVNAQPSILLGLIKNHYPNYLKQIPNFIDYIENRHVWINEYGVSKMDIIHQLNKTKCIESRNQRLVAIDKEIKLIQNLFWDNFHKIVTLPSTVLAQKNDFKQNKYGRYLNLIMTYYEDIILQKVIKEYPKVETPMYDGFTLDISYNVNEVIKKLNEITKDYHVKWANKEHSKKIKIDKDVDINFKTIPFYDEQKKIFEKDHFIIKSPLMYGWMYEVDGEKKYKLYKKGDFRDLNKPIKHWKIGEKGNGYEAEFFVDWIEDENNNSYKEIGFKPTLEKNPEVFNSFNGFQFNKTRTKEECIKAYNEDTNFRDVIDKISNHLFHLSGNVKEGEIYLWKYLAHMFQKAHINPLVAVILKSKQGHGKDTLINIIEKLMKGYVFRTADLNDIFGDFNIGIRDKLLVQMNEVEGKDGFCNKEKIKNMITEEESIIREKHVSSYSQKNYKRIFIFSNNLNPIEISFDDRRFVVFQAHHKKPSNQYFKDLYSIYNDSNKLQILFDYLINYDISDFSPKNDRPITQAYNNMKEHNINPLYKYLWDMFIKEEWVENYEKNTCYKKEKNNTIIVNSTALLKDYNNYLSCEDMGFIKPSYKILKALLSNIGIQKKNVKTKNISGDFYFIYKDELKEELECYDLQEEVVELDEDEWVTN